MICLDIETFDPQLLTRGPSARFNDGNLLCGAWLDDSDFNFRQAHRWTGKMLDETRPKMSKMGSLGPEIRKLMRSPDPKVFANASYELAWFHGLGYWNEKDHRASLKDNYTQFGKMYDVIIIETLLSGDIGWSLDKLATKYNLPNKPVETLVEAVCSRIHNVGLKKEARAIAKAGGKRSPTSTAKVSTDVRAWLWALTGDDAGWQVLYEYNKHDVETTMKVFQLQQEHPDFQQPVQTIEALCTPIIALMESNGVRVCLEALQELQQSILRRRKEVDTEMTAYFGAEIPDTLTHESRQILGAKYNLPRTKTGVYSVSKETLKDIDDHGLHLYREREILKDLESKFIRSILRQMHDGRGYPKIYQVGTDKGGTITGRLSYQGINLQNQPKPKGDDADEGARALSKKIRQLFIPDDGKYMVSADYASQEPRIQAELAYRVNAPGAKELVQAYKANPQLSIHEHVRDLCNKVLASKGLVPFMEKHHAKPINLGIPYGSGKKKVSAAISNDPSIGEQVYDTYVAAFPSQLHTRDYFQDVAEQHGEVQTLFGRKSKFDRWQVDTFRLARMQRWSREDFAVKRLEYTTVFGTLEELQERFPTFPLSRCQTYAAFNRVVQGTAADQTKLAMIRMYYLYNILPLIQVHDEILFQIADIDQVETVVEGAMNKALDLNVPVVTEYEVYERGWCTDAIKTGVVHAAQLEVATAH